MGLSCATFVVSVDKCVFSYYNVFSRSEDEEEASAVV